MKRILITGKNSYIGTSFEKWLAKYPNEYMVDKVSLRDESWKDLNFSIYDVVLHVAGIAHRKEKSDMKDVYYTINRDLTIEIALKSKKAGVSQFIFMSTMAVYGEIGKIGEKLVITPLSAINPKTLYGVSKAEAEKGLNNLKDDNFKVVCLRPPMVYGQNCPGNYPILEKLAIISPIFPLIENERSMVHIDKLCQCIKEYIDNKVDGTFFPQDDEYVNTSLLVKELSEKNFKSIHLSKVAGKLIMIFGKKFNLINKVFGNLVYEK